MTPAEERPRRSADRRAFWAVLWGLAAVEAVVLAVWNREGWAERPGRTLLIVTLVPVLVLGHVNVFPAALAAWLVRRRARRQPAE